MRNPVQGGKKHHWMLCATVYFDFPTDEEGQNITMGNVPLNFLVTSQFHYISAERLGKAQQGLAMRAIEKLEAEVNIKDVVINSINYLGHMTDKEFAAPVVEAAELTGADALAEKVMAS